IAETLFRQWFIEEAQDDWEEITITDLFEIRDGTHDSPKKKAVGKPLITSKHILDGRLDIGNAYLISEEDFDKVNQRSKVDAGDILFSMIGTIGLIYLEKSQNIDYAIKNIGLFKTSQNPDWAIYTYLWLKSSIGRQFIDEHKSGSTQEYVSLGSLRSIIFQVPPTDALRDFNTLASEYFRKMSLNSAQIRTLEKLRDALLPKLMSSEVRVKLD
ncbi:MAG: restriction endonuclease subunit S, partial [Saprospiraceae bacterium]